VTVREAPEPKAATGSVYFVGPWVPRAKLSAGALQGATRRSANAVARHSVLMDDWMVVGERVRPQPGCYGRWVTDDVIGPVKGAPPFNADLLRIQHG
jgi:hypothetical protein